MSRKIVLALILLFIMLLSATISYSQIPEIQCGDKVEAEISISEAQEGHRYRISLSAGDKITIHVDPFGQNAVPYISIYGIDGTGIYGFPTADVDNYSLPSTGVYEIGMTFYSNVPGKYDLSVGCTLGDGQYIAPGSNATNIPNPTATGPDFSGNGFPGLKPKDFSDGVVIPLTAGAPNAGSITTNFTSVFGYTFDAKANDVFALDFKRLSGNLNLGLAVLSPDNKIVFQASLVTSDTLSTQFTLPSDGTYTIGVYKIDLLPPASPENTAFQITGTLNP